MNDAPPEAAKLADMLAARAAARIVRVKQPGIFGDLAAEDYHRDPCPAPSLSASIARVLVDQSPKHAWAHHPRLGGTYDDKPDRQKELGTAAHKLLFGRGAEVVVVDAKDYKGGAAQKQRARAYEANCAPILSADAATVEAMVDAAREQLLAFTDLPELRALVDGKGRSESVIVWREGEAWCRSMIDWLHPAGRVRVDYKTTSSSAHPQAASTRLYGSGTEVADRFYARGLRALGKPCERGLYIVQESEAPYALSVVELDYQAQEIGDEKVTLAIETWQRCIAADHWPGYVARVAVAECPGWHATAWNNRQLAYAALAEAERPRTRPDMLTEIAS